MTVQSIYRILCDAPHCTVSDMIEKIAEAPAGWVRLDSFGHMRDKAMPEIGRGRHRRRLATWDAMSGGFAIALCPEHRDAFGEHHPQPLGNESPKRAGQDQYVRVGCACGWAVGAVRSLHVVGRTPSSTVEAAWHRHLPEELRWYATREVTA